MRNETILERTDGSKVKIETRAYYDQLTDSMKYDIEVYVLGTKKRKWEPSFDSNALSYRKLDPPQRRNYEHEQNLGFVTLEEIKAAQMSLWEKMKP